MPLFFIGIFCTNEGVVNAMQALSDKPIRYALSIPFEKLTKKVTVIRG